MWRHPDAKAYPPPSRADPIEMTRHLQYYQSLASAPPPAQPRRPRPRSGGPGPADTPLVLSRPRHPTAEANALIDAMCALSQQEAQSLEWILDLEFGPPHSRPPAHRHVAYYDAAKRVVMSASQPNTVHRDFLRCNETFRALLVQQYARRDTLAACAQPTPHSAAAVTYHDLYRMMEEQKHLQSALAAASARQAYRNK